MEKQELYDMCKTIIDLNKQKYVIVKAEIEKTRVEIEIAEREANLELAAKLKYGKLPELNKQLEDCKNAEQNSEKAL